MIARSGQFSMASRAAPFESLGDVLGIGDRPAVVGQLEDLGAQRQAHAVARAPVLVDVTFMVAVTTSNSMCSSVSPRRMYVGM